MIEYIKLKGIDKQFTLEEIKELRDELNALTETKKEPFIPPPLKPQCNIPQFEDFGTITASTLPPNYVWIDGEKYLISCENRWRSLPLKEGH